MRALTPGLLLVMVGWAACDPGAKKTVDEERRPTPVAPPGKPTGEPPPSTGATQIRISGSTTLGPLVTKIARRYESSHEGAKIEVSTGGSDRGLADLRAGKVDLAMISRAAGDGERDLQVFPIARDGLCLVVHRDNPIAALTDEQVANIYSGKVKSWKELGGKAGPISAIARGPGHSSTELFDEYFKLKPEQVKAKLTVADNEKTIKAIAANKGAIGYASIGIAAESVSSRVPIKLLPMNGVYPLTRNVRNNTYPLSRELSLVAKKKPAGLAEAFIKYCLSPLVEDLTKDQFFVGLNE